MAYSGIRARVYAQDLKDSIEGWNRKMYNSIKSNDELNQTVAEIWAQYVTPYVPYSAKDVPHHLNEYNVRSDGRVNWYRSNSKGEDITQMLYEGEVKHPFTSKYAGHQPQAYWDEAVRPGTHAWSTFIEEITPLVLKALKKE